MLVNKARDLGADFCETRFMKRDLTRLTLQNGVFDEIKTGITQGFGIRVIVNGNYGFAASSSSIDGEKLVSRAIAIAKAKSDENKVQLPNIPAIRATCKAEISKNPAEYSIEEKIALLEDAEKALQADHILSTRVIYEDFADTRIFLNSGGTTITINDGKLDFRVQTVVRDNGKMSTGY